MKLLWLSLLVAGQAFAEAGASWRQEFQALDVCYRNAGLFRPSDSIPNLALREDARGIHYLASHLTPAGLMIYDFSAQGIFTFTARKSDFAQARDAFDRGRMNFRLEKSAQHGAVSVAYYERTKFGSPALIVIAGSSGMPLRAHEDLNESTKKVLRDEMQPDVANLYRNRIPATALAGPNLHRQSVEACQRVRWEP